MLARENLQTSRKISACNFLFCTSKMATTTQTQTQAHVILFPEFGVQAQDYGNLVSAFIKLNVRCDVLHIWPSEVYSLKRIGKPYSPTFESWVKVTSESAITKILTLKRESESVILFAHGAGVHVLKHLHKSIKSTTACFGCNIVPDFHSNVNLVADHDELVKFFDQKQTTIVKGGHFSCTSEDAAQGFCQKSLELWGTEFMEDYRDHSSEIAEIVLKIFHKDWEDSPKMKPAL